VEFHVHAALGHLNAFALEQFALETGVRLTNQEFSGEAHHAVPGNAFAGGACGHSAAGAACSAPETKSPSKPRVGDNPPARDLFHELIYRSPRHSGDTFRRESLQRSLSLILWLRVQCNDRLREEQLRQARVETADGVLDE